MLTLLEPPGRKGHQRHRSAQQLLNFALDDEDFDVASEAGTGRNHAKQHADKTQGCATRFLDKHLVWKSNSADANEKWRKEFRVRPSWCDADLCLQQIKRGRATGNLWALYSRSFIQKLLFWLGNAVANNALFVLIAICIAFAVCCNGLRYVHIETDIVKLWVSKGGRLDGELNFLDRMKANNSYNNSNEGAEIVRENGLGGGYQVLIQTPESPGQNALSKEALLKHVRVMEQIATLKVTIDQVEWSLSDICFKPAPPQIANDSIASLVVDVIDRIVPCIWITPIDCFWEGSKPLGPHPYLHKSAIGPMAAAMNSLPKGKEVRWSDFDPQAVIDEVHTMFGLGSHYTFFQRTGLGHGYMDRPCIDPLDPDCPPSAPNFYDICPVIDLVLNFTKQQNATLEAEKEKEEYDLFDMLGDLATRKRREAPPPVAIKVNATEAAKMAKQKAEENAKKKAEEHAKKCQTYRRAALNWLAQNKDKWDEIPLPEKNKPPVVNYGKEMNHGCAGFAKDVLHWPEDMIMGGAKRVKDSLTHADALQSVFLVASPQDVYLRFKNKPGRSSLKPNLNQTTWNSSVAEEVLQTWQRNFTRTIYDHKDNFDAERNERRTLHPLASTSIADMLAEFCDFDYGVIFFGYFLMLLYALWTQMRFESCLPSSESFMGLALAGILVVTFSSVAGLGMATWFGIEFNAATTQIVPFLSLGIGVDNMFMLLHNYADLTRLASRDEMGILMRETGMTLLCTSTNNILSFLAGTMLPIPALRSFCAQISILLTFNFIAICTLYPAILSIDLRRRRAGRRDILCCLYGNTTEDTYSMITKPKNSMHMKRTLGGNNESAISMASASCQPDDEQTIVPRNSLRGMIRYYYIPFISNPIVKIFVVLASFGLIGLSIVGAMNANLGLELSDVLPEHTAPAQFLRARDKYFSFYPMFAVLKGPHIDYARQQKKIENYRNMIATSPYVIKNAAAEPSEKYWLGLMRDWLVSIQNGVDDAIRNNSFNLATGELLLPLTDISDDALIGHSLLCSIGKVYNCTDRLDTVRLVDKHGFIQSDGFYNYLTAWYNEDHMMYYVSQASFYPSPPKWKFNGSSLFVPPAEPLVYSQIPFYLTGLTDTTTIVKMIHDIRSICERFADHDLPNFPSGIAFTFWEQYLSLWANLMRALSLITLAVFIVISVLLFNPWTAANVVLMLIVMTIELAGFMGWAGIKLNPVSAVTLITAVGIGVEFTVHVAFSFLTSVGTRDQRSSFAVDRVFVPVIHGSFSTLLGILMLGFSDFEFVFKYFFVIMSALIVVGAINGLILLPVTLSWFGPPSEITPLHGKTTLVLPPPLETEEAEEC